MSVSKKWQTEQYRQTAVKSKDASKAIFTMQDE